MSVNVYQRRQAKEKDREEQDTYLNWTYMLGASFIDDFPSLLLYSRNFSFSSQCVCSEQQQQQQEQRAPMRLSSYEILLIEAHQLLYWIFNYDAINNANREFFFLSAFCFSKIIHGLPHQKALCVRFLRMLARKIYSCADIVEYSNFSLILHFLFWCAPLVATRNFRRRRSTERAFLMDINFDEIIIEWLIKLLCLDQINFVKLWLGDWFALIRGRKGNCFLFMAPNDKPYIMLGSRRKSIFQHIKARKNICILRHIWTWFVTNFQR